jgi:MFS transporter, AAHS family, 4-hydroxybenzoate transporter
LRRMGIAVQEGARFEDSLEPPMKEQAPLKSLFAPGYRRDTLGLWLAFFSNLVGVYLVFGWLPAMLTAQGLDLATASSGLAAYNLGGVLGVLLCVAAVAIAGSRAPLLLSALGGAASAFALSFVGIQPGGSHALLIGGLGLHGLFVNAVQTNLFAVSAHVYPTRVRASGTAFAGAIGRFGGLLSSVVGSAIIQAGSGAFLGFLAVCSIFAFLGLALVGNHFPGNRGRE